jgi:hypothetical protein
VTFQTAAYAVDGNQESGNFLRLMLQSASAGGQGIIGPTDLLVTANVTPTSGINIASGACIILGQETTFQGSYYGYNVGVDASLTIGPTSGSPRSDMIVARAEDPTWSGSPWGNPAAGQIIFPRVITNVSSSATTVPGNFSAIPLARIDMPASVSVVQSSYIHDLRGVANPLRILQVLTASGPGSPQTWTVSTTPHAWPGAASWQVPIPSWATTMACTWTIGEAVYQTGGNGTARGFVNPVIGSSVSSPTVTFPQSLISMTSTTGPWRHTIAGGGTVAIPAGIRGTTQTLQFAQITDGTNTGLLAVDEGSQISVIYEFQQLASAS